MALVKPKHSVPLGPVALDGVLQDLAVLRLEKEGKGDYPHSISTIEDPLGVRRLVQGILKGRNVKEQADFLDTFKEKVKAMATTKTSTPAPLHALEDAYTLMLHLYLHPQTALLKKVAHRILHQLVALADRRDGPTLEETQAQAFLQQWIQEKGLLTRQLAHPRAETSVTLQLIDEMAFFGPTRSAMCRGKPDFPIYALMRYTIEALAEAAAPFEHQRPPGSACNGDQHQQQQQRQHEGSVGLAQEALKAWTTLLAAWRSESEDGEERQSLLTWMCRDDENSSSASPVTLFDSLLNSTVRFLGAVTVPSEIKGQAALGLILAMLQACPSSPGVSEAAVTVQTRALQDCFLPTSSSSFSAERFPSFPALDAVAPLLATLAQTYPEARLSLAKALLIATPIRILTTPLPMAHGNGHPTTLLGGPALDLLLTECQSPLPPARLLSFMSLETWLLRAVEHVHAIETAPAATVSLAVDALSLKPALPTAANFLFWNWETTNRRVATVVPSAFERLVQLLQALEQFEPGQLPPGLLSTSQLATMLAKQPASRRSRYAGLKLLLPVVGAAQLLTQSPHLVPSLLDAITGSSSTAASASRLFLQLLRSLSPGAGQGKKSGGSTHDHDEVRALWLRPVAAALVDRRDKARRVRVADYLLEELLSLDPGGNILALLHELRRLSTLKTSKGKGGNEDEDEDNTALWALLVVAEVARRLGGGQVTTTKVGAQKAAKSATIIDVEVGATFPMLSVEEARQGCLSGHSEVRMAALRMLVASPKTTTLPTPAEQALLEEALPVALKAPLSSQRHGLERALRPLFLRYQEALRVGLGKLHTQAQREPTEAGKETQQAVQRVEECVARVSQILCEGFYPGTNVSRNAPTLDVLALFLAILQPPKPADDLTTAAYARALRPVYSSATTVHTLLNLFLAPWERTRRTAFDLLASFPAPLSGLGDTPQALAPAVAWALTLTLSARRGESEAGALMLRLVFKVYVVELGWEGIPLLAELPSSSGISGSSCSSSKKGTRNSFLQELVQLIEVRLAAFQAGFAAWGHKKPQGRDKGTGETAEGAEVVMVYGAVQTAKYVLEETGSCNDAGHEGWNEAVVSLMAVLEQALEVSLGVIGTTEEGLPESLLFEQDENGGVGEGEEEQYREEAALHTAGPGLVVDCRGHLIRRGGGKGRGEAGDDSGGDAIPVNGHDDDDEDGDDDDDTRQRLIVGGWMMVKEVGACLAEVVRQAVAPYSTAISSNTKFKKKRQQVPSGATSNGEATADGQAQAPDLLTCLGGGAKIDAVGHSLLQALGRMKHMGAIQVTQAALLAVSKALLLCSSHPALALLPRTWMEGLLDRLRNPRQHFVLRRSAGLASGFLSIVGAEPTNRPPILLPTLMTELLALAAAPLEQPASNGSNNGTALHLDGWRTRIHALNVLRLLLLDSGPSRDVAQRFMAPAMEVVLGGFRDARWAVRNSALMVFGALINSVVGSGKNSLGAAGSGEGSGGGVVAQAGPSSAHDFLRRHPDFLFIVAGELKRGMGGEAGSRNNPVLARALTNLAGVGVAAVSSFEETTKATTTSLSLFPLILLMSRLRPPSEQLAEDETSSALDLSLKECLPSVAQCACLPDGLMRLTAARAFASLVGPSRAPLVVAALVSALPSSGGAASATINVDTPLDGNILHGFLLMVNALLRGALGVARRLRHEDTEEFKSLGAYLAPLVSEAGSPVWEDKTWLAGAEMPCPPVREEALQMVLHLHHLFMLVKSSTPKQPQQYQQQHQGLHNTLCGSLTDLLVLIRGGETRLPPLPGFASLLAWATRWSLLLSLQDSGKESDGVPCLLEEVLTIWLRHGVVEVRQESLRVLFLLLNKRGVDLGDGKTEEDETDDYQLMDETVRAAQHMSNDAVWQKAEVALVAQAEGCEQNPNLIKGQMTALCLLLERKECASSSSASTAAATSSKSEYLSRLVLDASSLLSSSVSVVSGGGGDIAARGLELMGHLVRQKMGQMQGREEDVNPAPLSSTSFRAVLEGWVGLVEAAAVPEQTPAMRWAALQSVRASGLSTLLMPTSTRTTAAWQGPFLVRTLFVICLLVQDDEDGVREAARAALAEAVCDGGSTTTRPLLPTGHPPAARSSPATPCLDLLAGRALAQLTARNSDAAHEWTRAVVRFVSLRTQGLAETLQATVTPPCLGLPHQIFRPEPDNVYEEQAVVSYWAVRSLLMALAEEEKELRSSSLQGGEAERGFEKKELEGLLTLQQQAGLLAKALHSSAWIGGLTNHPDVFSKLFAAALGRMLAAVLFSTTLKQSDDHAVLLEVLEERGMDHPLMAWALSSLRAVLLKSGGESVQARARMVFETVDWTEVENYAPFVRPSLE